MADGPNKVPKGRVIAPPADGGGESAGAAYPNDVAGGADRPDGDAQGGQSVQTYYGPEQLGERKLDDNQNAASKQKRTKDG